jgi:hypothetical protein
MQRIKLFVPIFFLVISIAFLSFSPAPTNLVGYTFKAFSNVDSTDNANLTTYIAYYDSSSGNYTSKSMFHYWENVYFVALYTDSVGTLFTDRNSQKCYINYSDQGDFIEMDSEGNFFIHNRTFSVGQYSYSIICNSTDVFNTTNTSEIFNIYGNLNDTFLIDDLDDTIGPNPAVAFADIDNDQDQDIFLSGLDTLIFWQDDSNSFSSEESTIADGEERNIAFTDIDNDEDLDIIVNNDHKSGSYYYSKIYENIDSTFLEFQEMKGGYTGEILLYDFDSDGLIDNSFTGLYLSQPPFTKDYGFFINKNNYSNFYEENALAGLSYSNMILLNKISQQERFLRRNLNNYSYL